jgi:hypothetical protein
MKLFQLIAGVEFNGAAQDSFDLATLVAEQEVNEAIARREIPVSPINSAVHVLHEKEKAVQIYLTQHKMRTGLASLRDAKVFRSRGASLQKLD